MLNNIFGIISKFDYGKCLFGLFKCLELKSIIEVIRLVIGYIREIWLFNLLLLRDYRMLFFIKWSGFEFSFYNVLCLNIYFYSVMYLK